MVLKETVDILKSRNCRHEDKETAYTNLVSNLKNDTARMFEEELKAVGSQLLKLLYRDILATDEKILINILQVLKFCMEAEHIRSFQKAESEQALKLLIQCGQKTTSADVIKAIFDCLSVQKFHPEVLSKELSLLVDSIEAMNNKIKAKSVFAVEKVVYIFVRLEEQIGKSLGSVSSQWARLVFPGLVNASENVREKSLRLLEGFKGELCSSQELSKHVMKALNAGLAKSLSGLLTQEIEIYVLKTWSLIVQITGKELHKGSTINSLLEIIEVGFKRSHVARHHAFIAWRSLIDNFALDKLLIADPKRIKLLLMVLKIDNAKVEHVAIEKLITWWHFCLCIGPKLATNFELIVHPLLQFCIGGGKQLLPEAGQSPKLVLKASAANSPGNNQLPASTQKRQLPVFPAVQKLGFEVIGRLVSKVDSVDPGKIIWTIAPLPDEVFSSPAIFIKHAPVVITSLHIIIKSMENAIEGNLMFFILISLANHLKIAMDSSLKTECRDLFSAFLNVIHSVAQDEVLQPKTALKMIEICSGFPPKVLASTAYNITGGQTVRGCPAQLFIEALLTPSVMKNEAANENFYKLFSSLVSAGASNVQGALLFLQTVTEMIDAHAASLAPPEILWKMWNVLASVLQNTINTTNEVNQGDALEYNFGSMYVVLLLPIKHHLASKLTQAVCKVLLKTWQDLYRSFARLAALVATAEANTCIEEMSTKILQMRNQEFQDPMNMEFVSTLCLKMVECVDFSAAGVVGGMTLSPSKWVRRRQRLMGNLHSFVHLLATLQTDLNGALSETEGVAVKKKQESTMTSLILIAHTLVEVYTKLFAHVTSAGVISNCLATLARSLAILYQSDTKSGSKKLYSSLFLTKLEKLWLEIAQCVSGRFNGHYDSEFLNHLSPLLEMTFLHNRRSIKSQTLTLWNTTFGQATVLEYPNSLKPILMKMKEKNAVIVPGLISNDEMSIVEETPFSEMTVGDSQIPPPVAATLPSPKQLKGSHLNRDASPSSNHQAKSRLSPAKPQSPIVARNLFTGTKKLVDIDLFPKQYFVVIDSPTTTKKRPLTEHQKEVLKQKSVLPAMYNSVEASQDVSLMSHFGSESQHSLPAHDVILVNSSESQELGSQHPVSGEGSRDHVENGEQIAPQYPSLVSSRRRSVRIKELQNSVTEITSKEAETAVSHETDLKQKIQPEEVEKIDHKKKTLQPEDGEKDTFSNQGEGLVQASETDSNLTHGVSLGTYDNLMDSFVPVVDYMKHSAPFEIFRNKQTEYKVNLSLESVSTKSPRRISLRRVRSQDDTPNVAASSALEKSFSPGRVRTPRRVPLKKINEQECEMDGKSFHHFSPSRERSQQCGTNKEDQQIIPVEECNTIKAAQTYRDGQLLPVGECNDSNAERPQSGTDPEQNVENKTNAHSILVEDTQSPFKVKQSCAEANHSIAETPVKGEDSSSPPVRSASARKLFSDYDTANDILTQDPSLSVINEGSNKHDEKTTQECLIVENPELTSSQGFETSRNMNNQSVTQQTVHEFLLPTDLEKCKEDKQHKLDTDHIIQPESDNLFPSAEDISQHSMDMMMPTLPSSVDKITDKSNFNSLTSSNSKTSSSSDELPAKLNSSSESDFVCSQPTLTDEVVKYVPNKRKRTAPERLCHVKCKSGKNGCRFNKSCPECGSVSKLKKRKNKEETKCSCSCSYESDQSKHESFAEMQKAASSIEPSDSSPDSCSEEQKCIISDCSSAAAVTDASSSAPAPTDDDCPSAPPVTHADDLSSALAVTDVDDCYSAPAVTDDFSSVPAVTDADDLSSAPAVSDANGGSSAPIVTNVDDCSSAPAVTKDDNCSSPSITDDCYSTPAITDADDCSLALVETDAGISDIAFTKVKTNHISLLQLGEVTPESSPKTNPDRGHSAVKRMGRSQKRKLQNVDIESVASKKVIIEVGDYDKVDSNKKKEIKIMKEAEGLQSKLKLSRFGKKTSLWPSPKRHVLRTRNKIKYSQLSGSQGSPLMKKRKLSKGESSDEDNLPLSSFLKNSGEPNGHDCSEINNEISDIHHDSSEINHDSSKRNHENSKRNDISDVNDIPVSISANSAAVEDSSEKSDIVDLTKSDCCEDNDSEQNVPASQQLIPKSTSCSSSQHINAGTEQESNSLEFSSTDSLAISQDDLLEPAICASPDVNGQDLDNVTAIVENVAPEAILPKTSDGCEVEGINELEREKCFEEMGCATTEQVPVEAQHHETLVKGSDSESLSGCGEKTCHDEDLKKKEGSSKIDVVVGIDLTKEVESHIRESSTRISQQSDVQRSPEKNVQVIYDWSPHRSPGCSILKRCTETPPSGKSRRVSFAEPIVSGESPVRDHFKSLIQTSPLVLPKTCSPLRRVSLFSRNQKLGSRRRLDSPAKQEPSWQRLSRKIVSPQTQSSYKPTQESQLDNSGPVFLNLVGCTKPLDDILPQLTSSLWYRGLCQLMKARNINTIGDLSSLTEVQIDQLPIRNPKVESVKSTLSAYMMQHGLAKIDDSNLESSDVCKSLRSKGSTTEPEVTPASIDDEGIPVHVTADRDLEELSPIKEIESPELYPEHGQSEPKQDGEDVELIKAMEPPQMLSSLLNVVEQFPPSSLQQVSLTDLFNIHQTLNLLFTNVVEEMKSRQTSK